MAASQARTMRPLRSSPTPVASATETQGLACERSAPGRMPTTVAPSPAAPRDAAAITPGPPPQSTIAPARPSAAPTACASRSWSGVARDDPITAMYGGAGATSARDDVDQLVGYDDHFDHLVPVEVRLDARARQRQPLEFLARSAGWGRDAVADLAVDLADELERLGDEHRAVGGRPRLLP